ncbi:MAG: ATP-binding protein [Limnothrix sp.]
MKISAKFFTSSIALCFLIVTLVSGTNFWARFQAKKNQAERQRILLLEDQFSDLEFHLNQQIASLKDFLVLDRTATPMTQYQQAKSQFLITLSELEQKLPENQTLIALRSRYQNLQAISDNLADFPEEPTIVQQDIRSINSFHRDIDLYLANIRQEIRAELKRNFQREESISVFLNSIIFLLTGLIALLIYLQYRLVVTPVLKSINQLSKGVQRVATGDLQYRLNLEGKDEITAVATNFDEMTDVLEELYEELEQKVEKRTVELGATNENLKSEILKREVIEEELRSIYEDTRRSQQLLLSIINATLDWVYVKDTDYRFVLVNESFANHFEITPEEVIGKTIFELEHSLFENSPEATAEYFESIRVEDEAVLNGEPIHNLSDYVTNAQDITYIFDTQKSPLYNDKNEIIGILGVSRDVTDRHLSQEAIEQSESELRQKANELNSTLQQLQKTQAQIVQSEKMSSLGQMVAGVAHEINNPVSFISGNIEHAQEYTTNLIQIIELYQSEYPQPSKAVQEAIETLELEYLIEDIPRLLGSMTLGAVRIKEIVKSLRNFSRLDESEMKSVDIHTGLDSTLMILQNRLKGKQDHTEIHVEKHYSELPVIECYPGQLNQVFMNILSNAIDALEEYTAGRSPEELRQDPNRITITTQRLEADLGIDNWILIRIKDNGKGISEDVRKKLFNPFFTTKDVGKGTGLGLSISHSIIVEKHGGQLSCFSEMGHGTEFLIEIPMRAKKEQKI